MSSYRTTLVPLVAVIVVSSVGGCNQPEESGSPYDAQFEQARSQTSSDFVREVLEDNKVTQAEYEESHRLLVSCSEQAGVPLKQQTDEKGYHTYSIAADTEKDLDLFAESFNKCSEGTIKYIEAFYIDMRENPSGIDPVDEFVECLKEEGLIPARMSVDEYLESEDGLAISEEEKEECLTSSYAKFEGNG